MIEFPHPLYYQVDKYYKIIGKLINVDFNSYYENAIFIFFFNIHISYNSNRLKLLL